MAGTQISAYISDASKDLVERYAETHGGKKGRLVEEAIKQCFRGHGIEISQP